MGNEIVKIQYNVEFKQQNFHTFKNEIAIDDADTIKILVSFNISFLIAKKKKRFLIHVPKYMSLFIENYQLLK